MNMLKEIISRNKKRLFIINKVANEIEYKSVQCDYCRLTMDDVTKCKMYTPVEKLTAKQKRKQIHAVEWQFNLLL